MTLTYETIMAKIGFKLDRLYLSRFKKEKDLIDPHIEKQIEEIKKNIATLFDSYVSRNLDVQKRRVLLLFSKIEEAKQFAQDITKYSICFKDVKILEFDMILILMKGKHPLDVKWEPSPNQA